MQQQVNRKGNTIPKRDPLVFLHSCQSGLKSVSFFVSLNKNLQRFFFQGKPNLSSIMVYFFLICLSIIEFCLFYFALSKTFYCFLLLNSAPQPDKCQCIRFVRCCCCRKNLYCQHFFVLLLLFWPGNLLIFITTDLFLFMQIKARHADLVCMLTTQVDCLHNKKLIKIPKTKWKSQTQRNYKRKIFCINSSTHWKKVGHIGLLTCLKSSVINKWKFKYWRDF